MKRVQYVKQRARRLAEEDGIPYREALRVEGRRAAGLREASRDELRRAARHGKLAAVPSTTSSEKRAQDALVRPLDVELPGEAESREREVDEVLEDVLRRRAAKQ